MDREDVDDVPEDLLDLGIPSESPEIDTPDNDRSIICAKLLLRPNYRPRDAPCRDGRDSCDDYCEDHYEPVSNDK